MIESRDFHFEQKKSCQYLAEWVIEKRLQGVTKVHLDAQVRMCTVHSRIKQQALFNMAAGCEFLCPEEDLRWVGERLAGALALKAVLWLWNSSCQCNRQSKTLSWQNLSFDFVGTILVLSTIAERPKVTDFYPLNPLNPKIPLVILPTVCQYRSCDVSSENLMLDQLMIP